VAEDHQTKNAMSLVHRNAARLVPDAEAEQHLVTTCLHLLGNEKERGELASNIRRMARRDASREIVETITSLLN
jgi:UDP-N-acetylglucosamine--N-acetylmuramyl-(pentapeptide) pyrophosphoryl-undecaprenol N-acetylglucosamine transferase